MLRKFPPQYGENLSILWQRSREASKGGINAKERIIHYNEVGEFNGIKNVRGGHP